MTVTNIAMYPDPEYSLSVDLESKSFKLRFYSNTRNNLKHFDLYDAFDTPVVLGTALVPNLLIFENLDISPFGLTGVFVMLPYNESTVFEDVLLAQIPEKYFLVYLSE